MTGSLYCPKLQSFSVTPSSDPQLQHTNKYSVKVLCFSFIIRIVLEISYYKFVDFAALSSVRVDGSLGLDAFDGEIFVQFVEIAVAGVGIGEDKLASVVMDFLTESL